MTRPLRAGLVLRLEQRIDELAAGLLVRQGETHPELNDADATGRMAVLQEARDMLRSFFASYLEGSGPQSAEMDAVLRDGARRAGQAASLEDLLAAYHEGGTMLWEAAVAEAGPGEHAELIELTRHLLHWQGLLARAAAESFVRELRHLGQGTEAARRMLAQALLADGAAQPVSAPPPREELVQRAGVRLPDRSLILAYHQVDPPRAPGASAAAVQECLESVAGEPVLADIGAQGGVVLLDADLDTAPEDVLAAMAESLGVPLIAGSATATGAQHIPAAAREARELRALAAALELRPGVYHRGRLLLEHALSARRSSLQALAALLDPLTRRPNLLTTLETWFANDFDRGGTAEALAIHRNTLDYRLRRVSDLTGLALDAARGLQTAGAALLARRLLAAPRPD